MAAPPSSPLSSLPTSPKVTSPSQSPLFRYINQNQVENLAKLLKVNVNLTVVDSRERTPLLLAVECGNEAIVSLLLSSGKDLNPEARGVDGMTALLLSVVMATNVSRNAGNPAAITELLVRSKTCNLEAEDAQKWTALAHACFNGLMSIVRVLVEHGANTGTKDTNGEDLLYHCVSMASPANKEAAMYLVNERGLRSGRKSNKDGRTALHQCVKRNRGCCDLVRLLVGAGCDVNAKTPTGATAVFMAAEDGDAAVVETLLQLGAHPALPVKLHEESRPQIAINVCRLVDLATRGALKATCVEAAKRNLENVKSLLKENPLRAYERDDDGQTPLHLACHWGAVDVVAYLVNDCKADVDATTNSSRTPLHAAMDSGQCGKRECLDTVRILLKAQAHPALPDARGTYPVTSANDRPDAKVELQATCVAVRKGSVREVERLITENPKRVYEVDGSFRDVLLIAAIEGHTDIIRSLGSRRKGTIDGDATKKSSPLRVAVENNREDAVMELLDLGANPALESGLTIDRKLPLNIALSRNLEGIARALTATCQAAAAGDVDKVKKRVDINIKQLEERDAMGRSPLFHAILSNRFPDIKTKLSLLSTMVQLGAEHGITDKEGTQLLHAATMAGSVPTFKYLMALGHTVESTKALHGKTLLHIAVERRRFNMVKFLLEDVCVPHWIPDAEKKTALNVAKEKLQRDERYASIVELIERYSSDKGWTPLHVVAFKGDLERCKDLVRQERDRLRAIGGCGVLPCLLKETERDGDTPIWKAARCTSDAASADVLGFLLREMGPQFANSQSLCKHKPVTLVYQATKLGHLQVVRKLITEFGVDPSIPDSKGLTPYKLASVSEESDKIHRFLQLFAEDESWHKIHIFATLGQLADVEAVLREEPAAYSFRTGRRGDIALLKAANEGHLDVVERLIEAGGGSHGVINFRNLDGQTAMFRAALNGHIDVVRLLLERYGADPSMKGKTPYEVAGGSHESQAAIRQLLEGFKHDDDWRPVHVLSYLGRLDSLEALFLDAKQKRRSARILLMARTKGLRESCLHKAARAGAEEVLHYLLWNGIDARQTNNQDQTAETLARMHPQKGDRLGEALAVAVKRPPPPQIDLLAATAADAEKEGMASTSAVVALDGASMEAGPKVGAQHSRTASALGLVDLGQPDDDEDDCVGPPVSPQGSKRAVVAQESDSDDDDEGVEVADKDTLEGRVGVLGDKIYDKLTSTRTLTAVPSVPTLGDIGLSFVQKYSAIGSINISWPESWVVTVSWLSVSFKGWMVLNSFYRGGSVYWICFCTSMALPSVFAYFLFLVEPPFQPVTDRADTPFGLLAASWVHRYDTHWDATMWRYRLYGYLPSVAVLLLGLYAWVPGLIALGIIGLAILFIHVQFVQIQRQIYLYRMSVLQGDRVIPEDAKRTNAFRAVRDRSCSVYLFCSTTLISLVAQVHADNFTPGRTIAQVIASALLIGPTLVLPLYVLYRTSRLASHYVAFRLAEGDVHTVDVSQGGARKGPKPRDAPSQVDHERHGLSTWRVASRRVGRARQDGGKMWASLVGRFIIELRPEDEAYREKAVRMVESDSNTSAVKALIRKAILPFERRRHWFFCYLMCERAVMVMIVTLPSGRQAQTIQLFLALCLELVGAMIISRTQPFLQSDEDLADIGSRATNLVCVIVGILLALHGIRNGVAQYVLYIFTVMYILHFVYALDLRRVWRTFVNVVHLIQFQRKYGSYDKQKIKDLTEDEIASMDAYSVCYGWDTRRHLMLLRWHKDLAPKLDTYIRAFILNGSYLGGRITPYIGLLVRLEVLDLSNNSFHGPIPESLGYLVRLRKLLLQRNYLQGGIPESLTKLQSLEAMDLSFNYLEGSVPRAIFLLPSLSRLDLSFNHLTGTVPPVGFGGRRRSLDVIATRTQLSGVECGPLASVTSPRWEKVKELERVAENAKQVYDTDMAAVKSQTMAAVVFLRMAAVHVAWLIAVPFICIVAPVTIITLVLAGGSRNIYLAWRGRPYEETPNLLRKLYVVLEPFCRLSLGLPNPVSVASAPSILDQLLRTDSVPKLLKHPSSCLQHLLDIVHHKVHKPPPRVKRGATKAAVLRSVLSATRRSASASPHRAKTKWTQPLSARARDTEGHTIHDTSTATVINNRSAEAKATAAERDEGKGGGVTSPPTGAGYESSTPNRSSVLSFALPFGHRRRSRGVVVVPAGVEETVAGEADKEMPEELVDEEFIEGLYVPRTAVMEVEVDTAVE